MEFYWCLWGAYLESLFLSFRVDTICFVRLVLFWRHSVKEANIYIRNFVNLFSRILEFPLYSDSYLPVDVQAGSMLIFFCYWSGEAITYSQRSLSNARWSSTSCKSSLPMRCIVSNILFTLYKNNLIFSNLTVSNSFNWLTDSFYWIAWEEIRLLWINPFPPQLMHFVCPAC